LNRAIVLALTRSLPLLIDITRARSWPAMSSSDVRRAARSNAKFGAAEKVLG